MCGIAGLLSSAGDGERIVEPMIDSIVHRGPDDRGVWSDIAAGVVLGHRRLSIVDLSPLGHQPMESADGRYVLVYNGEIYNHAEMRAELDAATGRSGNAIHWRGHSDTETLLECIAAWGLEASLTRAAGMFALALWDRRERRLFLARDRFGEKPLYYGWVGGDFVFASELKAIRRHPRFDNNVSRAALRTFASRGYVAAPHSIYENIFKLEPGCILAASAEASRTPLAVAPIPGAGGEAVRVERYWSYREVVEAGLADPIASEAEALERLEEALATAIAGQSVADVPVGAFLSGGIDSSTVVALYRKYSPGVVRTFSIGFEDAAFNEAEHAKEVARHFGTEHHERYVSVGEMQSVIPRLPTMYDEPFADASQVPTYLVSEFAREQVTVALSGDGGDELFGGYTRHIDAPRLWSLLGRMPSPVRRTVGGGLGKLPPKFWNQVFSAVPGGRRPYFGSKVQRGLRVMARARNLEDVYSNFVDDWGGDGSPVLNAPANDVQEALLAPGAPDAVRLMYRDAVSYLPDDILCKVDRAAMSVSLETRVPFLDHKVAEVAARIPVSMKVRGGKGKHILRQLLYRNAPRELFERPKAGFAVPLAEWLRGPLRPWAEALIEPDRVRSQGYFDAAAVQQKWQQHLRGDRDESQALWSMLMFQAWHDENVGA